LVMAHNIPCLSIKCCRAMWVAQVSGHLGQVPLVCALAREWRQVVEREEIHGQGFVFPDSSTAAAPEQTLDARRVRFIFSRRRF
jgi:hypothetical protein